MELKPNEKLDISYILQDLEHYVPRRKGWHWREGTGEERKIGEFTYSDTSDCLKQSEPLPAAHYFHDIDPQPDCVITSNNCDCQF